VPAFGIGPLIAASLGIILLGLLRTPLRWSGAVLVVVAALWAARVPQPDILISADGRNVGVRGADGLLHFMHAVKGSPGCLSAEGVAGGGCGRANGG
jgi:competence protein ComEC